MPDLDLYAIHGLDRRAPSEALAAQLTAQLNGAADPVQRQRLDIARAILGDPQRRARYDAQLGDPAAPPITEAILTGLAGRPAPVQAAKSVFAQPRVLAALAAFLGVLLIVVVSAVACSGGGDDSNSGRDAATPGTPSTLATKKQKPPTVYSAEYRSDDASFVPSAAMRIDSQLNLESTARKLGWTSADFGSTNTTSLSLARVTESGNIELTWCDEPSPDVPNSRMRCFAVTASSDLRLLSDAAFPQSERGTHTSKGGKVGGLFKYVRVTSGDRLPTEAITVKGGYTTLEASELVAGERDDVAYFVVPGSLKVYKATVVRD
ncbi:hypothetical protein nbrc107696_18920 [Gordonia spumicola]|uniref:Uncharacterized protein n=1 Tax=Gordonia spumicola TaxID=589161 RepID=A0A7I9V7T3_9ACTN|nr:hypothetical protein [Gordonia spumicola]GEE01446.1 hypothetical protein nbrc107696_18920 [Gordonia spumicola]